MTDDPPELEPGGDPVCWLHRLCPVCSAVPATESPRRCWRCGALLPADPDPDPDPEQAGRPPSGG